MSDKDYALLSRIAPTVPQAGEYADYSMPWQEETKMIGRALGREQRAEQLVAAVKARARARHPEFDAQRLVAMKDGAIAAEGDPADVLTEQMLADVFDLEARVVSDPVAGTPMVVPIGRRHR